MPKNNGLISGIAGLTMAYAAGEQRKEREARQNAMLEAITGKKIALPESKSPLEKLWGKVKSAMPGDKPAAAPAAPAAEAPVAASVQAEPAADPLAQSRVDALEATSRADALEAAEQDPQPTEADFQGQASSETVADAGANPDGSFTTAEWNQAPEMFPADMPMDRFA